jgi:hypothetical protein
MSLNHTGRRRGPARGASNAGRPPIASSLTAKFLTALLKDGPVPSRQVKYHVEDAGLSWRTAQRVRIDLGIIVSHARKFGVGGFWQWELPQGENR